MIFAEELSPGNFPTKYRKQALKYYRLTNDTTGTEIVLTNFGASVLELKRLVSEGRHESIIRGFSSFDEFNADETYRGRTIGRWANRIGGSKVQLPKTMQSKVFRLDSNEGKNTLHGGSTGWSHQIWDVIRVAEEEDRASLVFGLFSPDKDMGFPGNVNVLATFTLAYDEEKGEDEFRINYAASTDFPTFINMTFHGYFNLDPYMGNSSMYLATNADRYVKLKNKLATGHIVDVAGTALDFRKGKQIGMVEYDDCLLFPGDEIGWVRLYSGKTGRYVHMHTTERSFQLYTGNPLGIALEAQKPVGSLEMPKWSYYKDAFTTKNKPYMHQTAYRIGTIKSPKII